MKLGEGGEAFFVFETFDEIPESLQTSPVISPASTPSGLLAQQSSTHSSLQEPEFLDLNFDAQRSKFASPSAATTRPTIAETRRAQSELGW